MKLKVNLEQFKNSQLEQKIAKEHTILVVDYEPTNVQSLVMLLDKEYHVLTAQDGDEALALIQNDPQPEQYCERLPCWLDGLYHQTLSNRGG